MIWTRQIGRALHGLNDHINEVSMNNTLQGLAAIRTDLRDSDQALQIFARSAPTDAVPSSLPRR